MRLVLKIKMKIKIKSAPCLAVALLLLLAVPARAQQDIKQERETSIRRADMPERALSLLSPTLESARRIHYYHQSDGQDVGFEVKFKWQKSTFSVAFDSAGRLIDVEILKKFHYLPPSVQQAIGSYLDQHYDRWRITRSQVQYAHPAGADRAAAVLDEAMKQHKEAALLRYELEVDGRREGELLSHELLFDQTGQLIRQRTIIRRQVDNIIY